MQQLGHSALDVSRICLGTMTFGTQTDRDDAHNQLSLATEQGVNFVDTAEMYPVNPISPETVGRSESIVGEWLAQAGNREKVVLATKITGSNPGFVRDGRGIDASTLVDAVHGSLNRLQTDVIDLYQLHWPNRGSYHFRQNWTYDPTKQSRDEFIDHIGEVLKTADSLVRDGKIRYIGLSNESAWGTSQWLRLSDEQNLPRVQTIQNEYSLLCRGFDTDLAELAHNERVDLLAFSPLATGLLTGKYAPDTTPPGSRRSISPDLNGRITERVWQAIASYEALAEDQGMTLLQLALGFCQQRPFMGSTIVGATTASQLKAVLEAADTVINDDVLAGIDSAHRACPMPY
ncbi:MAG: aldo/keto reductase [Pseudomonadota bacterium]